MLDRQKVIYEEQRNSLIPAAKQIANNKHGKSAGDVEDDERERWCNMWNFTFHSKMDELYNTFIKDQKC